MVQKACQVNESKQVRGQGWAHTPTMMGPTFALLWLMLSVNPTLGEKGWDTATRKGLTPCWIWLMPISLWVRNDGKLVIAKLVRGIYSLGVGTHTNNAWTHLWLALQWDLHMPEKARGEFLVCANPWHVLASH